MIRAAIAGGTSTVAGEILKLIINHPDVELIWVDAPEADGVMLSQLHKGLRGESYMRFSTNNPIDEIDVLFLCHDTPGQARKVIESSIISEKVKIIDVSSDFCNSESIESGWIYGLPELNRKPLVRGAIRSTIPDTLATAVLIALLPMAKNLMLNADIHVSAVVPDDYAEPGEPLALLDHPANDEITTALRTLQSSFNSPIYYVVTAGGWKSGLSAVIYLKSPIAEKELQVIYDQFYEDHSFTFMSDSVPSLSEVSGTNKSIINIQKVESRIVISIAIDDLMKKSALAIHNMNLLFGLQERVGLMLKSH